MPHVDLPQADFKVVLLGDTFTGKTSLVLRFAEGYYRESARSATVGAFFITKRLTVSSVGLTCKIQIWDTAGQEQFKPLAPMYYKSAAAAIVCYDATCPKSLETLKYWLDELHKNVEAGRIVIAMAACKTDLLQQQQQQYANNPADEHAKEQFEQHMANLRQVEDLAAQMGAIFVPTSAKNNHNVTELFSQVAERVLQFQKNNKNSIPVTLGGGRGPAESGSRSQPSSPVMSSSSKKPASSSALPSLGLLQRPGNSQRRSKSMTAASQSLPSQSQSSPFSRSNHKPLTDAEYQYGSTSNNNNNYLNNSINDEEDAFLNDMSREDYLHRRNHHVASPNGHTNNHMSPSVLSKTNSLQIQGGDHSPVAHMTKEAPEFTASMPGTMCGDTDIINCSLVPERFQDKTSRCVIL